MFPLVILAGGRGERMGGPKGLVPVGAEATPLLLWQLQRHRAAGGRDAIVVLGHDAPTYLAALDELTSAANGVRVAVNARPELGPFSSLHMGLAVINKEFSKERAVFVLPVDVPAAQASTWAALARALLTSAGGCEAAVPMHSGRGGHPVLLSQSFAQQLLALDLSDPGSRLDVQLRALPPGKVARVEVADPLVLENLNGPGDVERFNQGSGGGSVGRAKHGGSD